jgi:hypothetical protein
MEKVKKSASVDAMVIDRPKKKVQNESIQKEEKKEVLKDFKFKEKEVKDVSITRRVKDPANKVYRLLQGAPTSATIPSTDIIFDSSKNTNVEIRYAPGEGSIIVTDQAEKVRREPIIFRNGLLLVSKQNPTLISYLDSCNYNLNNPNRRTDVTAIFKIVDKTKDYKKVNTRELLKAEIVTSVLKIPLDKLLQVSRVYGINIDRDVDEIRHDLKMRALKDPKRFHEILNSESTDAKSLILEAKARGVLTIKGQAIKWAKSGGTIVNAPLGIKPVDHLTDLCMTDEGSEFVKELKKRLS